MQKKIIVLAIASALAAPALSFAADTVTVYGAVDISANSLSTGGTNGSTHNSLVSNNSFVGVKGSEAMDGGLTAVWQLEGTVDAAGTSGAASPATGVNNLGSSASGQKTDLFTRNTYIGVKSDSMGTVLAGRHDTPYKLATRSLDVFANHTVADNRDIMGNGHDARLSDVVAYISPNFNGVTIAAAYVGKNNDSMAGKSAVSVAGMYAAGPLNASLAYQSISTPAAGATASTTSTAVKLGAGYTMDAFTVNGVYESLSNDAAVTANTATGAVASSAGTSVTKSNFYLAGKYAISGTDAVKLAYTSGGASSTANSADDRTKIVVGYDHAMSKNTTVYALYASTSNNSAVNANPSAISVGLKHAF